MKIEIELTETEAACLWADVTWRGHHPGTLSEIAQAYVQAKAARAMDYLPAASLPGLIVKFRAANPDNE